jgi:hypothetical protein
MGEGIQRSPGAEWKYQEEFMMYGFTSAVINGEERTQCVICCEVLANESFKAKKN